MYEKGRRDVLNIIKGYRYKTIGVHFDYPEEILLERAKKSKRTTKVLSVSKDFEEVIINQRTRFQEPNKKDFDYFFKVSNPSSLSRIKKEVLELYK